MHRARKFWRACIALALAASTLPLVASPTTAYTLLNPNWPGMQNSLDVCIRAANDTDGFTSSSRQDHLEDWINDWNAAGADVTITIRLGTGSPNNCDLGSDHVIVEKTDAKDNHAASTETYKTGGCCPYVVNRVIHIDPDWVDTAWWNGSAQTGCTVGHAGCDWDMQTVVRHEFGHALGINDSYYTACSMGYSSTNDETACTSSAERIMNGMAGVDYEMWDPNGPDYPSLSSGYRREFTQDDYNGAIDAWD